MSVEQIAKDFGVHPMTLFKRLRQADSDEGIKPGVSGSDLAALREAGKRIKLLEQENEVLTSDYSDEHSMTARLAYLNGGLSRPFPRLLDQSDYRRTMPHHRASHA